MHTLLTQPVGCASLRCRNTEADKLSASGAERDRNGSLRNGGTAHGLNYMVQRTCIHGIRLLLPTTSYPPHPAKNATPSPISRRGQHRRHELLVVHLHPPIAVGVEALEGLRELLHSDTRAHEAVERDALRQAGTGGALTNVYPGGVAQ